MERMLEMLASVEVGGVHGVICARTFPTATIPVLYDIRYDDGTVESSVPRSRITPVMPPIPDLLDRRPRRE